jgi:hypothetical protein
VVVEPPAGTVKAGAAVLFEAAVVEPPPPHADRPVASAPPASSAAMAGVPALALRSITLRNRAAPSACRSAGSR